MADEPEGINGALVIGIGVVIFVVIVAVWWIVVR